MTPTVEKRGSDEYFVSRVKQLIIVCFEFFSFVRSNKTRQKDVCNRQRKTKCQEGSRGTIESVPVIMTLLSV